MPTASTGYLGNLEVAASEVASIQPEKLVTLAWWLADRYDVSRSVFYLEEEEPWKNTEGVGGDLGVNSFHEIPLILKTPKRCH